MKDVALVKDVDFAHQISLWTICKTLIAKINDPQNAIANRTNARTRLDPQFNALPSLRRRDW
jgi:hypothetical protein